MARNLAKHGYLVTAYNRTPKDVGGDLIVSSSLREVVTGADVVVIMVSDGAAVRNILFGTDGALQWLQPGTLVVNMSTIGVGETKDVAVQCANAGVELMDAPVSGSVGPAESGTLVVLAGGSKGAYRTMEPLFQVMGKSAHYLGDVGSGSAMKLLVNAYLGLVVEGVSECMAAADKAGIGRSQFLDVLTETSLWSPILAGKQRMWVDGEYPAAFALKHMTKDMALMSQFAFQMSAATPTLTSALNVFLSAQANDFAEDDVAVVLRQVGKMVGNE